MREVTGGKNMPIIRIKTNPWIADFDNDYEVEEVNPEEISYILFLEGLKWGDVQSFEVFE
jgi:hypothetical protein